MCDENGESQSEDDIEIIGTLIDGTVTVVGADGKTYASATGNGRFTPRTTVQPIQPPTAYLICNFQPKRTVTTGVKYTITVNGTYPVGWPGNDNWSCTVNGPNGQRSIFTHP
jgi:hypothetical protein